MRIAVHPVESAACCYACQKSWRAVSGFFLPRQAGRLPGPALRVYSAILSEAYRPRRKVTAPDFHTHRLMLKQK
jgi:hypothetical protein